MILDIVKLGVSLIDKIIPDPKAREEAKLKLLEQEQTGQLREMDVKMSAIVAEAKSKDKWTSRARPSFLYVIYILLLSSIPMGILFAISPEVATNVTNGFKAWLNALPKELYTLFGAGYLGYGGMRSFDKGKLAQKDAR